MLIVVHTDDVDGVCDDPRDAETFQDAFDKEFGVSTCDPESMLGVSRTILPLGRDTATGAVGGCWLVAF
eukprot:COSAG04_NODE_20495_length_392_cov_0.921502_1_plen_69_part_00